MNPYSTLGLSPDAYADEVRRAYRSLAFRYHPDVNPEEPSAERRFREIQRAYEILSDPIDEGPKAPAHESEIDRILKRLKASLTLTSGARGGEVVIGISLGKACIRERSARREKSASPTSGFVRPIPPRPPKAPRSPLSPVLF